MKTRYILTSMLILSALVFAACSPGVSAAPTAMMADDTATSDTMMHDTPTADAMMSHETPTADAMMSHETPTAEAMMESGTTTPEAAMQMADWLGTSLANAHTGQNFKISDYNGKVVLVEMMAVWCSTCHAQQEQIQALHQMLGQHDDLISVSLDIDPNEAMDTLSKYVNSNTFNWTFAVSPADLTRTISQTYGDQFLNPPSAPMLIIDQHGIAHALPFGLKSAEDLMKAVQQYLSM